MEHGSGTADFDTVVEQTRQALVAFVQGDSSGMKSLFSSSDDVVLANPLGPPTRGRNGLEEIADRAVSHFRDGTCEFEETARHATADLGYVFHIERTVAKVGESNEPSHAARHDDLSPRRRRLEDRPSASRSDHDTATRRVDNRVRPDPRIRPESESTARAKRYLASA